MPAHLSAPQLDRYCARIGYAGPRDATLTTLRALHRAHLLAIPYENLDIHLGLPLTLDREAMFTKLVDERRGGWCYEMNGVFGRVLETLGFSVRYLSGAVGRAERGWRAQGNHLVLLVTLDRPWIADVGFGDGFLTPLPLEVGHFRQDFLQYRGLARWPALARAQPSLRWCRRLRLHAHRASPRRLRQSVPRAVDLARVELREVHRVRADAAERPPHAARRHLCARCMPTA